MCVETRQKSSPPTFWQENRSSFSFDEESIVLFLTDWLTRFHWIFYRWITGRSTGVAFETVELLFDLFSPSVVRSMKRNFSFLSSINENRFIDLFLLHAKDGATRRRKDYSVIIGWVTKFLRLSLTFDSSRFFPSTSTKLDTSSFSDRLGRRCWPRSS